MVVPIPGALQYILSERNCQCILHKRALLVEWHAQELMALPKGEQFAAMTFKAICAYHHHPSGDQSKTPRIETWESTIFPP